MDQHSIYCMRVKLYIRLLQNVAVKLFSDLFLSTEPTQYIKLILLVVHYTMKVF